VGLLLASWSVSAGAYELTDPVRLENADQNHVAIDGKGSAVGVASRCSVRGASMMVAFSEAGEARTEREDRAISFWRFEGAPSFSTYQHVSFFAGSV
jgi:hypothetical protein